MYATRKIPGVCAPTPSRCRNSREYFSYSSFLFRLPSNYDQIDTIAGESLFENNKNRYNTDQQICWHHYYKPTFIRIFPYQYDIQLKTISKSSSKTEYYSQNKRESKIKTTTATGALLASVTSNILILRTASRMTSKAAKIQSGGRWGVAL